MITLLYSKKLLWTETEARDAEPNIKNHHGISDEERMNKKI